MHCTSVILRSQTRMASLALVFTVGMQADALAIAGFKEEGTKCFGRKEYTKAIESYEKAIKMLPEGHSDKALLHSNKAACHMMLKK